jgi:HPt (histidine-containing phosphotransfer) domain-containing protein
MRAPEAEEFRRQLDALGAEYRRGLPEKLAEIDRLWRALASGVVPPAGLAELRRALHTLAGSARTFGVAHVSEVAASAEWVLEPFCEQGLLPDPEGAARLARLLDDLQRAAGDS